MRPPISSNREQQRRHSVPSWKELAMIHKELLSTTTTKKSTEEEENDHQLDPTTTDHNDHHVDVDVTSERNHALLTKLSSVDDDDDDSTATSTVSPQRGRRRRAKSASPAAASDKEGLKSRRQRRRTQSAPPDNNYTKNKKKRPRTAYTFFLQTAYPRIAAEHQQDDWTNNQVTLQVAKEWKQLNPEQRQFWQLQASQERQEYSSTNNGGIPSSQQRSKTTTTTENNVLVSSTTTTPPKRRPNTSYKTRRRPHGNNKAPPSGDGPPSKGMWQSEQPSAVAAAKEDDDDNVKTLVVSPLQRGRPHRRPPRAAKSASPPPPPPPPPAAAAAAAVADKEEELESRQQRQRQQKKKRPVSAYNFFVHVAYPRIAAQHPDWPNRQVVVEIGKEWKQLNPEQRLVWQVQAAQERRQAAAQEQQHSTDNGIPQRSKTTSENVLVPFTPPKRTNTDIPRGNALLSGDNDEDAPPNGMRQQHPSAAAAAAASDYEPAAKDDDVKTFDDNSSKNCPLSSSSPPLSRHSRPPPNNNNNDNDDGNNKIIRSLSKKPRQRKDGTFVRPMGRARKGYDWDEARGVWVVRRKEDKAAAAAAAATPLAVAQPSGQEKIPPKKASGDSKSCPLSSSPPLSRHSKPPNDKIIRAPSTQPRQREDGTIARPAGRTRQGYDLDETSGISVLQREEVEEAATQLAELAVAQSVSDREIPNLTHSSSWHSKPLNDDNNDKIIRAPSQPRQRKDGTFARPIGRGRQGYDWDETRGVWVLQREDGVAEKNAKQKRLKSPPRPNQDSDSITTRTSPSRRAVKGKSNSAVGDASLCLAPKHTPKRNADGITYARPRGRQPAGYVWDPQDGRWIAETNGTEVPPNKTATTMSRTATMETKGVTQATEKNRRHVSANSRPRSSLGSSSSSIRTKSSLGKRQLSGRSFLEMLGELPLSEHKDNVTKSKQESSKSKKRKTFPTSDSEEPKKRKHRGRSPDKAATKEVSSSLSRELSALVTETTKKSQKAPVAERSPVPVPPKRKPGRPKGSKKAPVAEQSPVPAPPKRKPGRPKGSKSKPKETAQRVAPRVSKRSVTSTSLAQSEGSSVRSVRRRQQSPPINGTAARQSKTVRPSPNTIAAATMLGSLSDVGSLHHASRPTYVACGNCRGCMMASNCETCLPCKQMMDFYQYHADNGPITWFGIAPTCVQRICTQPVLSRQQQPPMEHADSSGNNLSLGGSALCRQNAETNASADHESVVESLSDHDTFVGGGMSDLSDNEDQQVGRNGRMMEAAVTAAELARKIQLADRANMYSGVDDSDQD